MRRKAAKVSMPISAIGKPRTPRDAGFTLVEALTTLAVIALMAGAVVIMTPGPGRKTHAFAEQFAARVAMASDESVISNNVLALVVREDGFGFSRLYEDGWRVIDHSSPLAFRPWPAEIDYTLESTAIESEDGRIARFDALGAATPAVIVLAGDGARWRIAIDGQGRAHVTSAD